LSALSGYWLAHVLDASIAGSMASMAGVFFGLAFLFAPERGLIARMRVRAGQRQEFAQTMLAIHLYHHEGLPEAARENRVDHLSDHLRWEPPFAVEVVRGAERKGLVERQEELLRLTDRGRELAQSAIVN
jgi:manganese/zinc/iron transport system permease protein